MEHPNEEVEAAIIRLSDALCSWERATGRQSTLILVEDGGYKYRAFCGKPNVPEDVSDKMLLSIIRGA